MTGGYGTFLAGAKLARGRKRRERLPVEPPEVEGMLERDTTVPTLPILSPTRLLLQCDCFFVFFKHKMERNVALKNTLLTHRFPFRAEEGVTLQSLVVLALHDVRKHFVVHLVRSAIRYSSGKKNPVSLGKKNPATLDPLQIK